MITVIDKAMFLKEVEIFSSVKTEELLRIAEISDEVCFITGQTIFSEGDVGDSLFFIIEGRVELRFGGKAVASVFKRGSFGSLALLIGKPRQFTAVAITDICALRISSMDFMDMLSENAQITIAMLRAMAMKVVEDLQ